MLDLYTPRSAPTVMAQARRARASWWLMFLGLLGISVISSLLMLRSTPSPSSIAWLLYLACLAAILYRPRFGVYLLVGLTLFGDNNLHPWYPFTKNFSSRESLLFLADALVFSPLETFIVATGVSWLGRMVMERRFKIHFGPIFWPAVLFLAFITYGLAFGLLRGGNTVIALWETRSIYYMLALLLFTANLIETRAQLSRLLWIIALLLFLKGIAGVMYVANVLQWDRTGVERIAEHSMSIHFNLLFVLVAAVWMYHDSTLRRLILPLLTPVVLFSFVANQRRAGFITLAIAVLIIVLLLYREHRKLFWFIAPTGGVAFLAYLAAFWNNTGSLGIMARAVRSVIGQPTARDAASNIYRDIENINIMFTIQTAPLQGVGFGQKFYIIAPMADISVFEWWEYITHNSVLWIWMKAGAGGFYALLLLVGMAMIVGGRMVRTMPRGELRTAALVASLYLMMHFIYAYVDMSWDIRSMVLVGTMMGVLTALPGIAARPLPVPERRWPWQPDPAAARAQPGS